MSISINVESSNKSVREYLRGILKAMEKTNKEQIVILNLEMRFIIKKKKKDC